MVKKKQGIRVCGVDRKLLDIEGIGYIYARGVDSTFWKHLTVIVATQGNHCLISL